MRKVGEFLGDAALEEHAKAPVLRVEPAMQAGDVANAAGHVALHDLGAGIGGGLRGLVVVVIGQRTDVLRQRCNQPLLVCRGQVA